MRQLIQVEFKHILIHWVERGEYQDRNLVAFTSFPPLPPLVHSGIFHKDGADVEITLLCKAKWLPEHGLVDDMLLMTGDWGWG